MHCIQILYYNSVSLSGDSLCMCVWFILHNSISSLIKITKIDTIMHIFRFIIMVILIYRCTWSLRPTHITIIHHHACALHGLTVCPVYAWEAGGMDGNGLEYGWVKQIISHVLLCDNTTVNRRKKKPCMNLRVRI